jgi:hypothetical protein
VREWRTRTYEWRTGEEEGGSSSSSSEVEMEAVATNDDKVDSPNAADG